MPAKSLEHVFIDASLTALYWTSDLPTLCQSQFPTGHLPSQPGSATLAKAKSVLVIWQVRLSHLLGQAKVRIIHCLVKMGQARDIYTY
ncbi:hypothetical protein Lal_00025887 [Lupinus albus]|uniref:Uncharacterized protein n=1 Tax=Lupinus albus TaxID=3870 RepID=A0A6A4PZI1_LUPAL|nr:hypothetical protein Lalb_Chr09g0323101 [Lupinus albus]KAF1861532.1 hypothetical protein Lal_00025887 [Lupinus albus]